MKVIIHAGIHRTGSTSLQLLLARNRTILAARGIAYPGDSNNHQKLVWELKRGASGGDEVLALIEQGAAEAQAETVVLSGEDFCILTDLNWLAAVAARHEVEAVFYLRRQDHWVMSWYNQHVKWPFDRRKSQMGPRAFLNTIDDFHWLDYATLLESWCRALGRINVTVGVVEVGQVEDVIIHFLDCLGIDPDGLDIDSTPSNDSLPVHVLEIARHLGLAELHPKQRTRLLTALRAGLANKSQPAKTVFSPEERTEILARFAVSNQEAARQFFDRDRLFLEPPPAPDEPYFRFPDLPRQKLIREWITPVIWHLLRSD